MKLIELRTTAPLFDDTNVKVTWLTEKQGYTLTLDQGTVTVTGPKMDAGRVLPWAACSGTPAPKDSKK